MISHCAQKKILTHLSDGLEICEYPYKQLAEKVGVNENELINFIKSTLEDNLVKRVGVVVDHRAIGYRFNAMVVWDIPDHDVDRLGRLLGAENTITLCYQRPRRLPEWTFNLFTMIHGKSRHKVLEIIDTITEKYSLQCINKHVLFSPKQFKQMGARY